MNLREFELNVLKESNAKLKKEIVECKKAAAKERKDAEIIKAQCEKTRIEYEEAIESAKKAREKYTTLYRECMILKRDLEQKIKKYDKDK